jgi:hypothetical protein
MASSTFSQLKVIPDVVASALMPLGTPIVVVTAAKALHSLTNPDSLLALTLY